MGGKAKSGRSGDPVGEDHLDTYRQAQANLDEMRVPVLLPQDDPHARLYIAALDGTGNSMVNDDRENWSAVARIFDQLEKAKPKNIAAGYVEGTFTQEGLLRTPQRLWDGRFGESFDERVETAYFQFCEQSKEWLEKDPEAKIHITGVGFSRGSEQVAALQRMIEERGIRDPDGAKVVRDRDNIIQKIEYADRPLLVAPGKTLQTALLFDPVVTGVEDEERTIPKSTLSVYEIGALHDRRNLFGNNDYVPPGFSEEGRSLNSDVAGAHSDIGGTYREKGLGVLSFNLGVEFLNRQSDVPFLAKEAVPDDPSQFVIHRPDKQSPLPPLRYGTSRYDEDGIRDRSEDQSPRPGIQRRDPIDPELEAQVERRTGPEHRRRNRSQEADEVAPSQDTDSHERGKGVTGRIQPPDNELFDRAFAAYMGDDDRAFARVMGEYRQSASGQAWAQEQQLFSASLREQEQQAALQREAALAEQLRTVQSGPVMRM